MRFGYRKLYIGGELQDAQEGTRHTVICPGNDETVSEVAWGGEADAHAALEAAAEAFAAWSTLPLREHTDWMLKLRDALREREELLREAVMCEMGKPWQDTQDDSHDLIQVLAVYPEEMRRLRGELPPDPEGTHHHQLVFEPIGPTVAILAWNFPLLGLGLRLAPALAAGCTIVIKPSPKSPLSAYVVGEVCADIGFPPGVINVLCGDDEDVGSTLASSRIPRLLTLIGSATTGRKLMELGSTSVKRLSLELGGNAPVLVFDDADLDEAIAGVAELKFANAGQVCVSPNRVFVQRGVAGKFAEGVVEKAKQVRAGFGRDSGATMGPLIDREAQARVDGLVRDAIGKGAELLCGGAIPASPKSGVYYMPTVLRGVTPDMRVFREEIFGPVLCLTEFDQEDEALQQANDTEAGLASYVYTNDGQRIQRLSRALRFGEVMVNGFKWSISLLHNGINESGVGHGCGSYLSLYDYLVTKRVTIRM